MKPRSEFFKIPEIFVFAAILSVWFGDMPAGQAATVGTVETVIVSAFGTAPNESRQTKNETEDVILNELLETPNKGALSLRFRDNSEMTLGSGASMQIDSMVYDPSTSNGNLKLDLVAGAFLFVSGLVPSSSVELNTPTATIGIRGTVFTVRVLPSGATTVAVLDGDVRVISRTSGRSQLISVGTTLSVGQNGEFDGPHPNIRSTEDTFVDTKSEFWRQNQQEDRKIDRLGFWSEILEDDPARVGIFIVASSFVCIFVVYVLQRRSRGLTRSPIRIAIAVGTTVSLAGIVGFLSSGDRDNQIFIGFVVAVAFAWIWALKDEYRD